MALRSGGRGWERVAAGGGGFSAFGFDIAGIGGAEKALDGWRGRRGGFGKTHLHPVWEGGLGETVRGRSIEGAEHRGGGGQSGVMIAIWQAGPQPWGFFMSGRQVGVPAIFIHSLP